MPVTLPPPLPWAAAGRHVPKPDSDHTGTISITVRVRRARQNAMKPQIQCVLAQWNPGFSASGRGPGQEAGRTVPMYIVWTGLLQPVEVFGR
jgi:hypothetical protein